MRIDYYIPMSPLVRNAVSSQQQIVPIPLLMNQIHIPIPINGINLLNMLCHTIKLPVTEKMSTYD